MTHIFIKPLKHNPGKMKPKAEFVQINKMEQKIRWRSAEGEKERGEK